MAFGALTRVSSVAAMSTDLEPPDSAAQMSSATLYLELVVNQLASGRVVSVDYRDDHYYVDAADLLAVSVHTDARPGERIAVDRLARVGVEYDSHAQRLELSVPAEWLPDQHVGEPRLFDRTPAATNLGLLINYDLFAHAPNTGGGSLSVWTEQRLFDWWGSLSNTGIYRQALGREPGPGDNHYLRYDTTWTASNEDRLLTYAVGDAITGALPWSTAVRLGGVTIGRNFGVRPDIITYPIPQFAGRADVPTAVDLFVNGSQSASGQVSPGPFTIDNVPLISGAGTATVVTTDVAGRQVSKTISFYVANTLLQKGLFDYSASAGFTRRGFGLRSFSYGKPAASGTFRYGLTNAVTLEGYGEGGVRLATGGIGATTKLARFGVLALGAARGGTGAAGPGEAGSQCALGYSYTARRFSVMLQRVEQSAGFGDLSRYDLPRESAPRSRRRVDQLTGALTLGRAGVLGAGYFSIETGSARSRVINASYSRSAFGHTSLHVTTNADLDRRDGVTAQVQLLVSLGRRGSVSATASRSEATGGSPRIQYSRNVPAEGGLGWNVGYAGDANQYRQADVSWRNASFQTSAGAYGAPNGYTRWGQLSGSAVVMDGGIFPANRVNDAFVLVDADGHRGVPVLFENQLIGRTDRGGHLLVPWVTSYYSSKYQIDPLDLPLDVKVPVVEQRIAVRRRSGAIVRFPIQSVVAATITLVDDDGTVLPLGLTVTHVESGQTTVVGWGGIAYFEGLQRENRLRVALPNGRACVASFSLDQTAPRVATIGPVPCR